MYGKGVTLRKLKNEVLALAAFNEAVELNAKSGDVYSEMFHQGSCYDNMGTTLLKLSRYNEALEAYKKACECDDPTQT